MNKEIIIVNTPLQDENTLNKQCINGEYPNWCTRTEGTKVGETFQDWWKRKQEWMGDKILGIYLYDIQPIGGIIGKPNEATLFIRYDYIKQKDEELPLADRGCCSECGEGYDNEPEWLYNTECELCGHPIPEHIIVKKP